MNYSSDIETNQAPIRGVTQSVEDQTDSKLVELVEVLLSIDSDSPMAKLNETSISDNNGGRIAL